MESFLKAAESRIESVTRFVVPASFDDLVPMALDQTVVRRHLTAMPAFAGKAIERVDATLIRQKAGRRFLVRYDVAVAGRTETLIGKSRAKGADRKTFAAHQQLQGRSKVTVPEPVGLIPELRMWLQRAVPGAALTSLIPNGRLEVAERAARALFELHHSDVRPARVHTAEDEMTILRDRLLQAKEAMPDLAGRIDELLRRCEAIASALPDDARTCIHRDFYPDHVLIGEQSTTLIDLDLLSMGDPAVDVGNFAAHVTEQALRDTGDPHAYNSFAERFKRAYLDLAGPEMRDRVEAYEGLSLARHVHISTLFPNRRHITASILDLCLARPGRWAHNDNSEVA
jgi:aminoglycoside phosphotransferase (APT) family kinase protein